MELYFVTLAAGQVVLLKESDQYIVSLSVCLAVCLFFNPSFIIYYYIFYFFFTFGTADYRLFKILKIIVLQ